MSTKTDFLLACSSSRYSHAKPPPLISTNAQQGMALLTVLLLVVAIVVVAGSMLASQKLSIRQTSLVLDNNQNRQNLQSGLVIAKSIIEQEQQTNDHDGMEDAWAKPMPSIELGGQRLQIDLNDASGRFNLNNLYQDGQVNDLAYASLKSLLSNLGLETNIAREILDFQDTDASVYGDGGDEQVVYADGGKFANQPFVSIEQLLALPSMDVVSYQRLRPFVSVSPKFLPINVNTADPLLVSAVLNANTQNKQLSSNSSNHANNQHANNQHGNSPPPIDVLPEQLPDFRTHPLKNVEELWQQPVFQAYLNRQQQVNANQNSNNSNTDNSGNSNHSTEQAKRMFAVSSQAFYAQVTINDKRQAYMTALIVKSESDRQENDQAPQQGFMIGGLLVSNQDNSKPAWHIIYPRYWAYQPQSQ
ncbi:type II secretion system minor pseudopilin GspK [Moraxella lincolnii]|uniref:type II secretion system minor pseudopilin GspK n=1 Tax=Lwoffella lincolnii TaxID=90241 RepID=UPI003984190C